MLPRCAVGDYVRGSARLPDWRHSASPFSQRGSKWCASGMARGDHRASTRVAVDRRGLHPVI